MLLLDRLDSEIVPRFSFNVNKEVQPKVVNYYSTVCGS